MARIAGILIVAVCAPIAFAQQQSPADKSLAFEVASVKPNAKTGSYRMTNLPGGGFQASLPLEWLIGIAYDIQPFQRIIGEPTWVRTQWFDIDAKPPRAANAEERKAMLRTLLEDRFGLIWKKDPTAKDSVWTLVMAREDKGLGPGIRVSVCEKVNGAFRAASERQLRTGQPVPCGVATENGIYAGGGQSIRILASTLQLALGEEIIDRTGLSGNFDYYLTLPKAALNTSPANADTSSIFTAIQEQLGMKLQREEIIRDAFIVVRVSQPTPN